MSITKNNQTPSILMGSDIKFKNSFTKLQAKEAVYFTGADSLLGPLLAIVYKESTQSQLLSTVIVGSHGVSEFTNITIDSSSRYYDACLNLPPNQRASAVRKVLAISCLRTFANMEPTLKTYLTASSVENQKFDWNETTAGALASSLVPALGKFPDEIGNMVIDSGILQQKFVKSVLVDIVYKNSRESNPYNDELLHLFGNKLEHLFDPLAEYSPERTELLYNPPTRIPSKRTSDNATINNICIELLKVQTHFASNLVKFFQDYLIPLRVKVLGGEISGINMQILNTIFPPTIDEIVRVNNIFFESLSKSVPFGSYETLKACGMSIPYFYKACMRHEAATKNFTQNLRQHMDLIQSHAPFIGKYTINRVESIINCSLHLTKIKLILDRLVDSTDWSLNEKVSVSEFYESAVGTIHSFGQESHILPYNNRIFMPNGRLLVEFSNNWPKELEYGWIQRRIVTIFDAFDVMCQDEKNPNVVFIFNDSVVVLKPTKPVKTTSEFSFHKASISDVIMHSMVNSEPLPEFFELDVVGWAFIKDVYMSEFGTSQLAMHFSGAGLLPGSEHESSSGHLKVFKLARPDLTASVIARDVSKAKILNKSEPFHLFYSKQPNFTTFGAVYEVTRFDDEIHKSPIALYVNMPIPNNALDNHDLIACISTLFHSPDHVSITVKSNLGYSFHDIVPKQRFSAEISKHISQLYNFFFSSNKPFTTENIIQKNTKMAEYLVNYATIRHHHPKVSKAPKMRISSTSTLVTSPVPSQASTIKQRVSSASSALTKLSQKFSQEPMRRKISNSLTDPKRRFSFSIFSRDKGTNLNDSDSDKSNEEEKQNGLAGKTMTLPADFATEISKVVQPRYSFSFVKSDSTANTPATIIENDSFSKQPDSMIEKLLEAYDSKEIKPLQPPFVPQTSKALMHKTIKYAPPVVTSKNPSKSQNCSYTTVHTSPTCDSVFSNDEIYSITSSSVVKDSERSICGSPSVVSSTGKVSASLTPSPLLFASVATTNIRKHRDLETIDSVTPDSSFCKTSKTQTEKRSEYFTTENSQSYRRTSSRLSDSSAPSISSTFKGRYSGVIRKTSFGSLETDYTTETSLDDSEITDSIKNITSFIDNISVPSFYHQPRVVSSEAIPQLPPIIFDDSDNLLDLVAPRPLPATTLVKSKYQNQHKQTGSVFSDDWQSISDDVSSLNYRQYPAATHTSSTLSFEQTLAELVTAENSAQINCVKQTVSRLLASTHSLTPLPSQCTLDERDQDRVVCVESCNRIELIDCLWSLLAEKNSGPAVKKFLDLEWERRSLMREKLGRAKPIQLWRV